MVTTRKFKTRKIVRSPSPTPPASSVRRSKPKRASQKLPNFSGRRTNETREEEPTISPEFWEQNYSDEETRTSFQTKDSDSLFLKSESDGLSEYEESEDDYSRVSIRPSQKVKVEEPEEEYFCPWVEIDPNELPKLELPQSSADLLVENHLLLDILELSPFLFEDFVCSLRTMNAPKLLAEIHIAFLKLLLHDDEQQDVTLSVTDTNNSFNIMINLIEPMTYAEVLRQYVESDSSFPSDVLQVLHENYPFVDVPKKIIVLKFLCERFLHTAVFKKIIKDEGKIQHDEHCRDCGKVGDVLLCDGCEACYHLGCAGLTEVPVGEWYCRVCVIHMMRGVSDLYEEPKHMRLPLRMRPLGFDRHGRVYWFLVRRIFVQDLETGQVYYYSSLPQVYELVSRFDLHLYETQLCRRFIQIVEKIAEQMSITLELTHERRSIIIEGLNGTRTIPEAYLHVDNSNRMSRIYSDAVSIQSSSIESEDEERISLTQKIRKLLGIENGILAESVWAGGMNESQLLDYHRAFIEASQQGGDALDALQSERSQHILRGFRLGFSDGGYRRYENQYIVNEYAKSPYLRAKDRDRKKYLGLKFAIADEGTFEWPKLKDHSMFKGVEDVAAIIQHSIRKLVNKIPDELVHRLWKNEKEDFMQKLQNANTIETLRFLLLQYERAVRKPIFTPIWWNTLGHTRLTRVTTEMREQKQAIEARKKKEEKDLLQADPHRYSNIVWVKYSKLDGPPKHNIWRAKDEQYRVNGFKKLGGWLWLSSTRVYRRVEVPSKPPFGITINAKKEDLKTIESKKAFRLEKIVQKLSQWRKESVISPRIIHLKCYSCICQNSALKFEPTIDGLKLPCYSPSCSDVISISRDLYSTADIVKAEDPAKKISQKLSGSPLKLGEEKPFPFPRPYGYKVRSTGKTNILVLPPPILRRVARFSLHVVIPGFHPNAKSNFTVWPYPCARPLFDNCWRFLTLKSTSLHAIALQLRILYACIRWADMKPGSDVPDEKDGRVMTHFPEYDEIREVIKHKEHPPDGYYEQYLLRIEQYSLDDDVFQDKDDSENYHGPGGPKLRLRKRKPPKDKRDLLKFRNPKNAKIYERWVDGVDLRLFEIKRYWQGYHRRPSTNQVTIPSATGLFSRTLTAQDNESLSRSRYALDQALCRPSYPSGTIIQPTFRSLEKMSNTASPTTSRITNGDGLRYEPRRMIPVVASQYQPLSVPALQDQPGYIDSAGRPVKMLRLDSVVAQSPSNVYVQDENGGLRTFVAVQPASQPGGSTINTAIASMSGTPTGPTRLVRLVPIIKDGFPQASTSAFGTQMPIRIVRPAQSIMSHSGGQFPRQSAPIRIIQRIPAQYSYDTDLSRSSSISRSSSTVGNVGYGYQMSNPSISSYTNVPNDQYLRVNEPTYMTSTANDYDNQGHPLSQFQSSNKVEICEPIQKSAATLFYEQKLQKTLEDLEAHNIEGSYSRHVHHNSECEERDESSYVDHLVNHCLSYEQYERSRWNTTSTSTQTLSKVDYENRSTSGRFSVIRQIEEPLKGNRRNSQQIEVPPYQLEELPIDNTRNFEIQSSVQDMHKKTSTRFTERIVKDTENASKEDETRYTLTSELLGAARQFEEAQSRTNAEKSSRELILNPATTPITSFNRPPSKRKFTTPDCSFDTFECPGEIHKPSSSKSSSKKPPKVLCAENVGIDIPKSGVNRVTRATSPETTTKSRTLSKKKPVLIDKSQIIESLKFERPNKTKLIREEESREVTRWGKRSIAPMATSEETITLSPSLKTQRKGPTLSLVLNNKLKNMRSSESKKKSSTKKSRTSSKFSNEDKRNSFLPASPSIKTLEVPSIIGPSLRNPMPKFISHLPPELDPSIHVKPMDRFQKHCYCKTSYDPKMFYIACNICSRWFHGRCIGITENQSQNMDIYKCKECAKALEANEDMYCVCKQPYDEDRFMIGCDRCEDWFHPECLGTTRENVESVDEYICPSCEAKEKADFSPKDEESLKATIAEHELERDEYEILERAWEDMNKDRASWPFQEPVDLEKYPTYKNFVKKPMDLSTVRRKLAYREYRRVKEFASDVYQMFENARLFNVKDTPIWYSAEVMEKHFRLRLGAAKEELMERIEAKKALDLLLKSKKG